MMEENVINGICCDVENCVYNNGSCCCTAHEIHVNHRANNGTETMCETFSEVYPQFPGGCRAAFAGLAVLT